MIILKIYKTKTSGEKNEKKLTPASVKEFLKRRQWIINSFESDIFSVKNIYTDIDAERTLKQESSNPILTEELTTKKINSRKSDQNIITESDDLKTTNSTCTGTKKLLEIPKR